MSCNPSKDDRSSSPCEKTKIKLVDAFRFSCFPYRFILPDHPYQPSHRYSSHRLSFWDAFHGGFFAKVVWFRGRGTIFNELKGLENLNEMRPESFKRLAAFMVEKFQVGLEQTAERFWTDG